MRTALGIKQALLKSARMKISPRTLVRLVLFVAVLVFAAKGYWENAFFGPVKGAKVNKIDHPVDVSRTLGSLQFEPCSLARGGESISAFCTTLDVPENHGQKDGKKIRLSIAWIPATNHAENDPIFYLAGGPGQGARESYPQIARAFAEALKVRDVILVDQRGTGESNALKCEDEKGNSAVKSETDDSLQSATAFAIRCAKSFDGKTDVSQYSTSDAIIDLDLVRQAIGAEQINLLGISYGTRVAQQYGKKYPEHVRTITLDGVAPNEIVLGQDHAKNLESSLDKQFDRCVKEKACQDNLGNPREQLQKLLASLKKAPIPLTYRDAMSGEWKEGKLSISQVTVLARMLSYVPQVASLLPLQFWQANNGHPEALMAISEFIVKDISEQIMHGMQLSVMCSEDVPDLFIDPLDKDKLLGTDLVEFLKAQCAVWPHKAAPTDFHAPLKGKVATLLLSGEFDPVTPPRYGDMVLKHLTNAKHIVAKGQGHNVLPIGCIPKLYAKFLESADPKTLDDSCVGTLTYAPIFTGLNGWQP